MSGNPGKTETELDGGHRRSVVLVYIISDKGPEFIAEAFRDWLKAVGQKLPTLHPGHFGRTGFTKDGALKGMSRKSKTD